MWLFSAARVVGLTIDFFLSIAGDADVPQRKEFKTRILRKAEGPRGRPSALLRRLLSPAGGDGTKCDIFRLSFRYLNTFPLFTHANMR